MVRIRMQRHGRKHKPFYRINAMEKRVQRDGRVLEALGWYDPLAADEDKRLSLKEDRIKYWLSVGAQPSDTCRDIFAKRDMLPAKMKAQWEADRKAARERVESRKAAQQAAEGAEAVSKPASE